MSDEKSILKDILDAITQQASPNTLIVMLASELKEQRKEINRLRLLIDHEEHVRTDKLRKVVPIKENSFLRGGKINVGDRVCAAGDANAKYSGTVVQVYNNRARIKTDAGDLVWKSLKSLRHINKSVS